MDIDSDTALSIKPLIIFNGAGENRAIDIQNPSSAPNANNGGNGWDADMRLSIIEIIKSGNAINYKAISSFKGKNIGFEISVPRYDNKSKSYLARTATIRSIGEMSDDFLSTIATVYRLKLKDKAIFIDSIKISFIDLDEFSERVSGKNLSSDSKTKKLKLFFETEIPDDAAELYANINEKEHWLELKEKDDNYRENVVKFLTKK
jgi:hypothetical protein